MDPLAWLGLKSKKDAARGLSAIQSEVRSLLPDDEPFVLRYIVIVSVLLTRVAVSDGRIEPSELNRLHDLFQHIDRMPTSRIDSFASILLDLVPELGDQDLSLCYRELKSLCDAEERMQVMRLLASQATADGNIHPSEHSELMAIAYELGIPAREMEELAIEVLAGERLSFSGLHDTSSNASAADASTTEASTTEASTTEASTTDASTAPQA